MARGNHNEPPETEPARRFAAHGWMATAADVARQLGWRAVAVVAALPLAAAVGGYALGARAAAPEPLPPLPPVGSLVPATFPPTTPAPPALAHIDGAVASPGLYQVPSGGRVADLIALAGGLTAQADTLRINLAQQVADGDRIVVPELGKPLPAGATPTGNTAEPLPVNVNTASETELQALPGVGPATAAAIARSRTQHGPFTSVDDLVRVPGIGPATLARLAPHVTT